MMTAPSKAEFGKVREWIESSGEVIPVEVRGSLEKILAVYLNHSLGATREGDADDAQASDGNFSN